MPFLREAPDNTLASTLGGLGSSLTEAWNPLNQIRAQDMLAQMRQRQWEIQQAQAKDAANANAAEVYGNANPHNQSPADLAVSKAQIRNGTFNLAPTVDALVAVGNLDARTKAAELYHAAHAADLPPDQLASDEADIRAGRKNASELGTDRAKAAEDVNRATRTIDATKAAGEAATSDKSPAASALAAEAAARGDTASASKIIGQSTVLNTPSPPKLASADTTTLQTQQRIGGVEPPAGQPPTSELQSQYDADAAARAGEIERQKAVGTAIGSGVAQSGNLFTHGPPGSPANPLGAPLPALPDFPPSPINGPAPAPATSPADTSGNVSLPNPANPSATPTPIITKTPAGDIIGETAPQATQRTSVDTANRAQLQEAVDAGVAGKKMLATLDRLKTLAQLAHTTGPGGQIPTWVNSWLADHHLTLTDRAGILAEMKAEFNAQIPELRKDMGVKFEAGPELSAQSKMIGDPSLPEQVLDGIFARQAAIAQLGVQRRDLAMRALYPAQANPLSVADYYKEEAKIFDNVGAEMQKQLKDYGAYGAQPAASSPPPPPPLTGGSAMDAIRSGLHWLYGGGANAAPQTPPQTPQAAPPAATEQWDVDANGRPVRVR